MESGKLEGNVSERPRTEMEKLEPKNPLKTTQTQEAASPTRMRISNQVGLNSLRRFPTSNYQEGMFARDYLNLRENPIILKMLQTFKEDTDNLMCFSDQIIRINHRENKEKRVLLVTTEAIYNLHPRKNFQVLRRIDLKKVHKLTVPENSAVLLAIHVKGE